MKLIRHPERASRDPEMIAKSFATGSLDFARDDGGGLTKEIFGTIEKPFVQGGVVFADEGGELLQFAALLRIQSRRHFHNHPRQQVTASASFNVHNSFAAEFKNLSALGASW